MALPYFGGGLPRLCVFFREALDRRLLMRLSGARLYLAGSVLCLLASTCFAEDATNPLSVCADHGRYSPTTCQCLAHEMPNRHLVGGVGPNACDFQNPPAEFDPSHSDKSTLESWGIQQSDAAALGDPAVRSEYFRGVERSFGGEACDHGVCGPGLDTTWHPNDGAPCGLTGALTLYCRHGNLLIPARPPRG